MSRNSQQIIEEWLVVCTQAGDRKAFERLLHRWQSKLSSYAYSQIRDAQAVEDVVQNALVTISKDIHKLKDPAAFPKWAYQILHRRGCDWIAAQQRQRRDNEALGLDVDQAIKEDDSSEEVMKALRKLDAEHHQVIRLFYLDGFSLLEIAEILNIPVGTVKSRLFNGRQKLKDILE